MITTARISNLTYMAGPGQFKVACLLSEHAATDVVSVRTVLESFARRLAQEQGITIADLSSAEVLIVELRDDPSWPREPHDPTHRAEMTVQYTAD